MPGPGPEGGVSPVPGAQRSRPRRVGLARSPAQSGRRVTPPALGLCERWSPTHHCSSRCSPKGLHSLTWETLSRGFRGQHREGSGGDPASPAAPRRRPARSAPPTARTIRLASCRVGSSFGARTASPRLLSAADDASGPNGPETFRGGRSPASIQGRETSRRESCTQERCTALESGADSALAGPALGPSARSGTGALRPHVEADWRRRGPRGRGEGRGPIQGGGPRCCEMTGVLAVEARDTARRGSGRGLTPPTCALRRDGAAGSVRFTRPNEDVYASAGGGSGLGFGVVSTPGRPQTRCPQDPQPRRPAPLTGYREKRVSQGLTPNAL